MELKARNEMDPRWQWDFTDIYPDEGAWKAALTEATALVAALPEVEGTLGESADSLKRSLDKVMAVSEKVERVYFYAALHKKADNSNSAYQAMEAQATTLLVALREATAFLDPELIAIPGDVLASYMADESLATYRHTVEDVTRARAHTLDAAREKLLARLSDAAAAPSDAFDMLNSVDMTFPPVTDENGQSAALTHGTFSVFRESGERSVRREAYEKYFGEFKRYINTLAAMYAGAVKLDCFFSSSRNFSSSAEAALFEGNVPVAVYDCLTDAIHSRLDVMERYLALRKKVLGLDELRMYDLYNPMLENASFTVPYEDAQSLVKRALAPLGEEYGRLLERAFAEKWIDVYESRGKSTGAFSWGVYGTHPYVLLNYTDTLGDAFTLAHELGHSMHSYLSSAAQDYVNHGYRIMVAEVASTVNEVLMTRYLLANEKDPRRKAYILNDFLEGFRTTVFRQTLFAEFERKAHEMYESGEPLTAESLTAVFRSLNELYYSGVENDPLANIEWARIPHFYDAFYVYQYATGFTSAVAIASDILATGDPSRYLEFLSMGGSDYPLEELKRAGIDLTRPDAVLSALDVFSSTLDELEALLGAL